ncbi:MAG: aminopeptidase P family N-terminal domain-containing protein, partial [Hungatella sp.]
MSNLGKQTDNIKQLRGEMQKKGIDWYLIPTADYHDSEYVTDYFKGREFISGFTGSNGTLLVSQNWAGLWTDGRYFIQAEQELKGTGITLYKMQEMGVPTILAYLEDKVTSGQVLAYDGLVTGVKMGLQLEERLKDKSIVIRYEEDLLSSIWTDRPTFPHQKIVVLPEEISGEKASAKIAKVRSQLIESGADYLLLTKLDDIMWLLNLRGSDIPCNPVALSYVFLSKQEIYLFVQSEAITAALTSY